MQPFQPFHPSSPTAPPWQSTEQPNKASAPAASTEDSVPDVVPPEPPPSSSPMDDPQENSWIEDKRRYLVERKESCLAFEQYLERQLGFEFRGKIHWTQLPSRDYEVVLTGKFRKANREQEC